MIGLQKVNLRRGTRIVLGPLSLTLDEPRIGIIGRNGSGKSSLAQALAGLVAPETGRIRIHGIDPFADRKGALATVGILFQNPDHQIIFPTVREEIAFGLTQMGLSKAQVTSGVQAVLARFGRTDWAERQSQHLSQGQRHLLCLMAVLAMEPKLLIFDEPFAGLDLPTQTLLQTQIAGLDQQVILITHDLGLLDDYDRVIWIEQGQIAGDGPPDQVIAAYRAKMQDHGFADLSAEGL